GSQAAILLEPPPREGRDRFQVHLPPIWNELGLEQAGGRELNAGEGSGTDRSAVHGRGGQRYVISDGGCRSGPQERGIRNPLDVARSVPFRRNRARKNH